MSAQNSAWPKVSMYVNHLSTAQHVLHALVEVHSQK